MRWLGLDVRRHVQHDAQTATVEFVARYRHGGAPAVRVVADYAPDTGWSMVTLACTAHLDGDASPAHATGA